MLVKEGKGMVTKRRSRSWRRMVSAQQLPFQPDSFTLHALLVQLEASKKVLGINYLPSVSNKSALGMKIILSCHYSKVSGFSDIHASTNLAITRMQ